MQNKTIFNEFFDGCGYVLRGISQFLCSPRLWLYALVPFLCVKLICTCIMYGILTRFVQPMSSCAQETIAGWGWENAAQVTETAIRWFCIIVMLIFSAVITGALFEIIGSPFFAKMVRFYEHRTYHRPLNPGISLAQDWMNVLRSVCFTLGTLLLYIPLLVLGFFLPGVTQVLTAFFIGYRYGIGYCSEAAFNRGLTIGRFRAKFRGSHRFILYGFGVAVFLVLMIPVLSAVFIPGLVIGGTILVNEECFPEALDGHREA